MSSSSSSQRDLPSVDLVLRSDAAVALIEAHGRKPVLGAVRAQLDAMRASGAFLTPRTTDAILAGAAARLDADARSSLRRVFNLTGTVLHTNLGRAVLPEAALAAIVAAGGAVNLEFDLDAGQRGERDAHVESLLARLAGAERAAVVNNNAAAVLLVLNTLARRREVIVSRGELIEIGGAFRMPEIMTRAGCILREVGTTNRTRLADYAEAIGPRTALILKVHPSNYAIVGFSSAVTERELAPLAREHGLALVSDLGAGALVDLRCWGLPHEPTVAEMIAAGVDLVTFSGDKLLGGPQAGFVTGRGDLVARLNRNALKRALRLDKLRLAALEALLHLYADPDRLAERLPVLRVLARPVEVIEAAAQRLLPATQIAFAGHADVSIERCESQVGSGSLPTQRLPSAALAIRPAGALRRGRARVETLARALRRLPVPVIGRVHDGVLYLDLRTLEDEEGLLAQFATLPSLLV